MFRFTEVYHWNQKTLCRIWNEDQIIGEVLGVKKANKLIDLLNKGKIDDAIETLLDSIKKPGLQSFLHREVMNNLLQLKEEKS